MTTTRTQNGEIHPPADVAATKEGVRLALEMPGVVPGTITVTVEDDVLAVLE